MKYTIIINTHNLVPEKMFVHVLKSVFLNAIKWDCEVIIVSHFPVLDKYEEVDISDSLIEHHLEFEDVIIKGPVFSVDDFDIKIKNYVVGERRYSLHTICDQIMIGLKNSNTDRIIIMEHDVLYPEEYICDICSPLDLGADFSCWKNAILLGMVGYYRILNWVTFGRIAWKSSFLEKYLISLKKDVFVDMVPDISLRGCAGVPEKFCEFNSVGLTAKYGVVEGTDVLDFRHGLNTYGNVLLNECFDSHPVWGDKMKWIDLIDKNFSRVTMRNPLYAYGLLAE